MANESPDVPELLRQADHLGRGVRAKQMLMEFTRACMTVVTWQKLAGRAFAWEGLRTEVFNQEIERWIEREKGVLRERLRTLLNLSEDSSPC